MKDNPKLSYLFLSIFAFAAVKFFSGCATAQDSDFDAFMRVERYTAHGDTDVDVDDAGGQPVKRANTPVRRYSAPVVQNIDPCDPGMDANVWVVVKIGDRNQEATGYVIITDDWRQIPLTTPRGRTDGILIAKGDQELIRLQLEEDGWTFLAERTLSAEEAIQCFIERTRVKVPDVPVIDLGI